MSTEWVKRILGGWLWLSVSVAWAQTDSLLHQADRMLYWRAYGRAIDAYTQLLTQPAYRLSTPQRATVQEQLAFAYQQVGDTQKAERFYGESLGNTPEENPRRMLQYAKALVSNGKFREGQQQYERYLVLKEKLPTRRLSPMPVGGPDAPTARQEAVRYRLEYLALNTPGDEFSPAFYEDGLVYVSGTKGSSTIETTGSGGGKGYLDLYYAPHRNGLKATSIINADGSYGRVPVSPSHSERSLGRDSYTPAMANDSRTVPGFDGGINIAEGLGFGSGSIDPAQQFTQTLNTRYHEGPATFSRDGSRIFFTRNNYNGGRARKSADDVTKLKLYTARQQSGAWTDVVELPFNSDAYSVGHPSLSHDERLLYFVSDMPGGLGGTDLYVSRSENGQWGKPVNLGAAINTKGNELFPFVDEGGKLYYSTDGRRGLGGLDVFMATVENGTVIRQIEHLDSPINSPQDDFGLITDGGRRGGYVSSNRRNGNDDMYRFVRESSLFGCRDLSVRLYDTETDQPLDSVRVEVRTRGEGSTDQILTTDRNGFVQVCLEANNDFMFQAGRDGFISSTVGFTTRYLTDDQPSRLEIGLKKPDLTADTLATTSAAPVEARSLTRSRLGGVVLSERDHRPLEGVTVRLRNERDHSLTHYVTKADGRYAFELTEGCDYTLIASKSAFGTNTNKIKRLPVKAKPKELSADLHMLSVGDVVTIDNIYYDLDRFSLRPDAARELEKLVATMRRYPALMIEIRSHTDSRGDATRNQILSAHRAKAVANYLTARGISRWRMTTLGMGESQLINNCTDDVICTDAEHQRNRRTEFKVVAIK